MKSEMELEFTTAAVSFFKAGVRFQTAGWFKTAVRLAADAWNKIERYFTCGARLAAIGFPVQIPSPSLSYKERGPAAANHFYFQPLGMKG